MILLEWLSFGDRSPFLNLRYFWNLDNIIWNFRLCIYLRFHMLRWIIQQRRWTVNNVSNQIQKSYIRNYNLSQTSSNKRLVICCDGTWQQSDAPVKLRLPGYRQRKLLTITDSHWLPESNVTRLYRGIASTDVRDDGTTIPQVVYYQNGIGSGFKRSYAAGSYAVSHQFLIL
jgi:hypothetical protein